MIRTGWARIIVPAKGGGGAKTDIIRAVIDQDAGFFPLECG